MSLQLGQIAPDFEQDSTWGRIRFHEWLGCAWGILFSHPKDYPAACASAVAEVARLSPKWEKSNLKPIALSADPLDRLEAWVSDTAAPERQRMPYPTLADADTTGLALYSMIPPQCDLLAGGRAVYVIDPSKKIRLILTRPAGGTLTLEQILSAIDLQLTDTEYVAAPVSRREGGPIIGMPNLSDEHAKSRFPRSWKTLNPHLCVVQVRT